jgi:hypothetical protein
LGKIFEPVATQNTAAKSMYQNSLTELKYIKSRILEFSHNFTDFLCGFKNLSKARKLSSKFAPHAF